LQRASSTYLLQHQDNPVDWWEWSDEAFAEAARRDVPVLLSVGYASCHWCHVMARESFSDPDTAALLNEHFVAIKVDREERPDVDAVYMTATQALTGHGGWPMTVFLTPDRAPFYAGTYFPPRPAHGSPSFTQLLVAIAEAWRDDREQVLSSADRITAALRDMSGPLTAGVLGAAELDRAAAVVVAESDPVDGGFGGAPKFPPALICEFLLRHHERTGSPDALEVVTLAVDRMAAGGLFDQLGGGFARYSTDRYWHVPHFEKMLEDQALLLALYTHHARLTGSPRSAEVATATAGFVLRELRTADGLFAASLDAETGGIEGGSYLWTPGQLREVLGDERGDAAARVFGVAGDEPQVLRRVAEPDDPETFGADARALLEARSRRRQPGRDDIVVLRSNGLMISALAEAGTVLDQPHWVRAADQALATLVAVHRSSGSPNGWRHSSRYGRPGPAPATLADLADLASAMLAVYQATGRAELLTDAVDVLSAAVGAFADPAGGWFDAIGTGMPVRPRDPTDGAAPSGSSSIAAALLTAAALTGDTDLRERAERTVAGVATLVQRHPRSAGRHLAVAEAMAQGPLEIALVGEAGAELAALTRVARHLAPGGSVVDVGVSDAPGHPLLEHRPKLDGRPAAYVCRGFVCDRPVSNPEDLAAVLRVQREGTPR
jgi:uncharacterized protein YyaL (SSP411 family)